MSKTKEEVEMDRTRMIMDKFDSNNLPPNWTLRDFKEAKAKLKKYENISNHDQDQR